MESRRGRGDDMKTVKLVGLAIAGARVDAAKRATLSGALGRRDAIVVGLCAALVLGMTAMTSTAPAVASVSCGPEGCWEGTVTAVAETSSSADQPRQVIDGTEQPAVTYTTAEHYTLTVSL